MKHLIKFYTLIIFLLAISFSSHASNKIKIGLVIPLSGENKELGESVLKSVRLAINDIDDNKIIIIHHIIISFIKFIINFTQLHSCI